MGFIDSSEASDRVVAYSRIYGGEDYDVPRSEIAPFLAEGLELSRIWQQGPYMPEWYIDVAYVSGYHVCVSTGNTGGLTLYEWTQRS